MQAINLLLLVEDDDNDVVLTRRKIQRSRLPVGSLTVARSLAEAKEYLVSHPVDVVLLDLNLGETNGLDTLRAVLPVYQGVVIALTSIDDEETGIAAVRLGADDYLVKNLLTEDRLRTSVAYAMVRHESRKVTCRIRENLDRLSDLARGGK